MVCQNPTVRFVIFIAVMSGVCALLQSDNNIFNLSFRDAHHLTVKRLRFRPVIGDPGVQGQGSEVNKLLLASCGADHVVRMYTIQLDSV